MSVQRVLALVESRFGLRAPGTLARIEGALARLSEELALPLDALVDRAAGDPPLARQIAGALLVSESHFLRDLVQLQAAAGFLRARRRERSPGAVRVWSAGCARGEEPLSLALTVMEQSGPAALAGLEILATDLDAAVIAQARSGLYRAWSMREVGGDRRAAFFTPAGAGQWRALAALSAPVRWAVSSVQEQLARLAPRSLDLILFRNVAIYLEPAALAAIYEGFARVLDEGGWLVLGLADPLPTQRFHRVVGAPHGVLTSAAPGSSALASPRRGAGSERPSRACAPRGLASAAPVGVARAEAWLDEGRTAVAEGRPTAAIEPLRRLLFLAPDHVLGRFWYALALSARGARAQARAQARALTRQLDERPADERLGDALTVGSVRAAVAPIIRGAP